MLLAVQHRRLSCRSRRFARLSWLLNRLSRLFGRRSLGLRSPFRLWPGLPCRSLLLAFVLLRLFLARGCLSGSRLRWRDRLRRRLLWSDLGRLFRWGLPLLLALLCLFLASGSYLSGSRLRWRDRLRRRLLWSDLGRLFRWSLPLLLALLCLFLASGSYLSGSRLRWRDHLRRRRLGSDLGRLFRWSLPLLLALLCLFLASGSYLSASGLRGSDRLRRRLLGNDLLRRSLLGSGLFGCLPGRWFAVLPLFLQHLLSRLFISTFGLRQVTRLRGRHIAGQRRLGPAIVTGRSNERRRRHQHAEGCACQNPGSSFHGVSPVVLFDKHPGISICSCTA